MQEIRDYTQDALSKEQQNEMKQVNTNTDIITRKAKKSNYFVIVDKCDYA